MVEFSGQQLKIVITGGSGLLAQTFQTKLAKITDHSVRVFRREELDILDKKAMHDALDDLRPDWLINCAAVTNVDKAEIDPSPAFNVNALGVLNIAQVANQLNIKVLHFSTDYVFDGEVSVPYSETFDPNPINRYGLSKLEGERNLVAEMPQNAAIIRTAWLYGEAKLGFISNIIARVEQREPEIQLVNDQIGQLTLASDVVKAATQLMDRQGNFQSEIYHVTNQNFGSWLEIGEFVNYTLKGNTRISGILKEELNRPALRPTFSALDSKKFADEFFEIRSWTAALEEYLIQNQIGTKNEAS
jgi:dTDP-4-dehydrorhamnose reductase